MSLMKRAAALLVLVLAGCSPWRLSEPGKRVDLGFYSVDPQIVWNITPRGAGEDWTVDGWALHSVTILKGVKDGNTLWPKLADAKNPPVFSKEMTPHEIAELLAGSLTLLGARKPRITALRPQAFGTLSGFRFDLEYADQSDLEIQGLAAGIVHEERLHLILYRGVKEYYFPKYRDPVERMIASIQLSH
jgi:hypothetical protein